MRTENRQSSRIAKELVAHVERVATVLRMGEDREVKVHVVDVSRDGIGFVAPEAFDRDAFVRLKIDVDAFTGAAASGKNIETACVVRDCVRREDGTYHVGAKLKGQTGRELETWADLISRWSQKQL